jgi:hypothetical protein
MKSMIFGIRMLNKSSLRKGKILSKDEYPALIITNDILS